MTTLLRTLLGAAAVAAAGCGGTADVAGTVAHQGKPVAFGTVVVVGADGTPKSGPIRADGSFVVPGVATGPGKVAVSSPPPPGAVVPGKKAAVGGRDTVDPEKIPVDEPPLDAAVVKGWFPIPEKYADPAKSGLTVDVGSGQPLAIDLK